MSGLDEGSRGDLLALVAVQRRMIDELPDEVAELGRRLGMDSRNSCLPSSHARLRPPGWTHRRRAARTCVRRPATGGFQHPAARARLTLHGRVSTMRKHGVNVVTSLRDAITAYTT